jgi:hypothetical protein
MTKAGHLARLCVIGTLTYSRSRCRVDVQRGRTVSAIARLTSLSAFARSTRR